MNEIIQWLVEFGQTLLKLFNGIRNFLSVFPKPVVIVVLGLALSRLIVPLIKKSNQF